MNVLFGALAAVLAAQQTPAPATPLTLDQAIAIADQNAFSIRIAQSNIEKSRQNVSIARGSMSPKVGLSGAYTRYGEATTANFGGADITLQPIDNTTGSVSLQMPLDISGNLHRQVQASEHSLAATQFQARGTVNDVHQQVRRAFFQVLRTQGLVTVAEAALRNAQETAATNQKLFQGDQIARIDLQRVQAQVAQSESDLVTAQNNLQLSQNALNYALGRPIETPLTLADVTSLPAVPTDPQPLVDAAQAARPEVKALSETVRALERTRRATESGMDPSLSASLTRQHNFGATAGLGGQSDSTVGVLTLNVPLWDAGVTRDRVKSARQDELQARINLEQTQLGISQEVRTALSNVSSARARLDSATRQVTLAEEVLRLAIIRQQAGEGTYLEIVDAETQVTTARNQQVSARYDYLTSYADLQHSLGTDTVPTSAAPAGAGGTK